MPSGSASTPNATAGQSGRVSLSTYNSQCRQAILTSAIKKKQIIYTFTGAPGSINNILNIGGNFVRMAGYLTKFIVEVNATFANLATGSVAETQVGRANLLSNVQFTDLQNNQRHNCSGMQLALTSARKRRRPFGQAATIGQSFTCSAPGANVAMSFATAPTTGANGSARCVYEIPVSINDTDLTGGIFLGVYGAQLSLQLQFNPNPLGASGDSTFNVFYGAGATFNATPVSSITVTVYQEYYDQLPMNNGAYVLPPLDISTVYQLTYTQFGNIVANADYYIPYSNYRKYISQSVLYNNSGADGGLNVNGTDVNYLALVAANFTNIFKVNPLEQKRIMRELFGTDLYNGLYVFDSERKPVDTQNYGNLQLDINPITAGGSAYAYVMSEFIAYQNQIAQAPSLPSSKG